MEVLDSSTEQAGRGRPAAAQGAPPPLSSKPLFWENRHWAEACPTSGLTTNSTRSEVRSAPRLESADAGQAGQLLRGETSERFRFVGVGLENGHQLGDLHQVFHLLLQVQEFHLAASAGDGGIAADHLAQTGTVDVADLGEIQQDVFLFAGQRFPDGIPEIAQGLTKGEPAAHVQNRCLRSLANIDLQAHQKNSLSSDSLPEPSTPILHEFAGEMAIYFLPAICHSVKADRAATASTSLRGSPARVKTVSIPSCSAVSTNSSAPFGIEPRCYYNREGGIETHLSY